MEVREVKLLLVDDEQIVLDSLSSRIDWSSAGIDAVFCCRNITEAKERLAHTPIDVLLCDIEMPGGSGLELLLWIQEQKLDVVCIMLTCHADFEYSVQALRLQGFDYILKPAENRVLLDAVTRAVERRRSQRPQHPDGTDMERISRHMSTVVRHLWADYLQQRSSEVPEGLLAETGLQREDSLSMILLQFLSAVPQESVQPIRQLAAPLCRWQLELSELQLLCIGPAVSAGETPEYQRRCRELLRSCQTLLDCPCNCILAASVPLAELPAAVARMRSLAVRNISLGNTVLLLDSAPLEAERFLKPNPEVWRVLLLDGRQNEFLADVRGTLDRHADTGVISRNELLAYATSVMNVLYEFSQQHCVDDPERLSALMAQIGRGASVRNLADFNVWLTEAAASVLPEAIMNDRERIVVRVKNYIHAHLGDRLLCEQIAGVVYLNVDYLERLFKRETGVTITDYIAGCRIEMAKKLISGTSMPISSIAQEIGYTSFSYFSKLFKRSTGMNPRDYRRKVLQERGGDPVSAPDSAEAGGNHEQR